MAVVARQTEDQVRRARGRELRQPPDRRVERQGAVRLPGRVVAGEAHADQVAVACEGGLHTRGGHGEIGRIARQACLAGRGLAREGSEVGAGGAGPQGRAPRLGFGRGQGRSKLRREQVAAGVGGVHQRPLIIGRCTGRGGAGGAGQADRSQHGHGRQVLAQGAHREDICVGRHRAATIGVGSCRSVTPERTGA